MFLMDGPAPGFGALELVDPGAALSAARTAPDRPPPTAASESVPTRFVA
jgi:hypothetical protein